MTLSRSPEALDAELIEAEWRMCEALAESDWYVDENPEYEDIPPLESANEAADIIFSQPSHTISGAAVKLRLLLVGCMGITGNAADERHFRALYDAICTLERNGARPAPPIEYRERYVPDDEEEEEEGGAS
jgi:hypothetical protein